ncbi:MAG: NifU family protein [Alphaproteobacteria bacterium]
MFLGSEATPNPANLKFLPGRAVLETGTADFPNAQSAARSPLARRLFGLDGVTGVFLGQDFITVTKHADIAWKALEPLVRDAILDFFVSGDPVVQAAETSVPVADGDGDDASMAELEEILAARVRPAVQQSGGDVTLRGFKNGIVLLELTGDAGGLLGPIGRLMRHFMPAVLEVRDYRDDSDKPGLSTPTGLAVQRVITERINPSVAGHGGYISLVDVRDETAFIRLEGGCQGCGMADVTLKQGIEVEIIQAVEAIGRVLDVTDHAGGTNPYYQPTGETYP